MESRLKEVEDIARRKVSQAHHKTTVANLEQQLAAARKTVSSQENSARVEIARLTALLKTKADESAALEGEKKQVMSFWTIHVWCIVARCKLYSLLSGTLFQEDTFSTPSIPFAG